MKGVKPTKLFLIVNVIASIILLLSIYLEIKTLSLIFAALLLTTNSRELLFHLETKPKNKRNHLFKAEEIQEVDNKRRHYRQKSYGSKKKKIKIKDNVFEVNLIEMSISGLSIIVSNGVNYHLEKSKTFTIQLGIKDPNRQFEVAIKEIIPINSNEYKVRGAFTTGKESDQRVLHSIILNEYKKSR